MISVWVYQAFLMEVLERVGLYLLFVTKFGEKTHFLKLQPLY